MTLLSSIKFNLETCVVVTLWKHSTLEIPVTIQYTNNCTTLSHMVLGDAQV